MSELICRGWDGANPLHALAAFGLLRLADRMSSGARLGWRLVDSAWRPVLAPVPDLQAWSGEAANWLTCLGKVGSADPSLSRKVRELGADLKKAKERTKQAGKAANAAAREGKLDKDAARLARQCAVAPFEAEESRLKAEVASAKEALANANGAGIAHLGDIIGVTPGILRLAGQGAISRWLAAAEPTAEPMTDDPHLVVRQLAALSCDQVVDGEKVVPTPLSFGNGSSGQCLLKDARSCLVAVRAEVMLASLLGSGDPMIRDQTGLNWDPAEQRSYALAWGDPATAGKAADVTANALAYLGLGLLPCMPDRRGLTACGWSPDKAFVWPLWEPLLPLEVVAGLLASPHRPDVGQLRAQGIRELRLAMVINPTGKRNFFAPSIPIG